MTTEDRVTALEAQVEQWRAEFAANDLLRRVNALARRITVMEDTFGANDLLRRVMALENTPLKTANWSISNPDIVAVAGSDPSAAAAVVIVKSVAPLGQSMMIQLNFRGDAQGADFYRISALGDTPESVAEYLANQISRFPLCQAANISAEWTPGTAQFGVTHHLDNLVTVSAQRSPECFDITQGAAQLDAGPILALNRLPVGIAPPAGSNIGQITFGSCRAGNPGVPSTEYGVIACNILNNDPDDLNAELAFYIVSTKNGQQTLIKKMSITKDGVTNG